MSLRGQPGVVIADGNARSTQTRFKNFDTLEDLGVLDFSILQKTVGYAGDVEKARKKAAELLVPEFLPINEIKCAVFYSSGAQAKALSVLDKLGMSIPVLIRPDWFFGSRTVGGYKPQR